MEEYESDFEEEEEEEEYESDFEEDYESDFEEEYESDFEEVPATVVEIKLARLHEAVKRRPPTTPPVAPARVRVCLARLRAHPAATRAAQHPRAQRCVRVSRAVVERVRLGAALLRVKRAADDARAAAEAWSAPPAAPPDGCRLEAAVRRKTAALRRNVPPVRPAPPVARASEEALTRAAVASYMRAFAARLA